MNDVAGTERPAAGVDSDTVKERAVGAVEVLEKPTVVSRFDFRMTPAYGCIVQNDFEIGKPAGSKP